MARICSSATQVLGTPENCKTAFARVNHERDIVGHMVGHMGQPSDIVSEALSFHQLNIHLVTPPSRFAGEGKGLQRPPREIFLRELHVVSSYGTRNGTSSACRDDLAQRRDTRLTHVGAWSSLAKRRDIFFFIELADIHKAHVTCRSAMLEKNPAHAMHFSSKHAFSMARARSAYPSANVFDSLYI